MEIRVACRSVFVVTNDVATVKPAWSLHRDRCELEININDEHRLIFDAAELAHAATACLRVQQEQQRTKE